jgi:hypothetical protein
MNADQVSGTLRGVAPSSYGHDELTLKRCELELTRV